MDEETLLETLCQNWLLIVEVHSNGLWWYHNVHWRAVFSLEGALKDMERFCG